MLMKNKNANNTNYTNDANEEKALCENLSWQILECAVESRLIVYSYSGDSQYSSHSR